MNTLTIGEVARRANLRASAIRYYEDQGLLLPPVRVNGLRRYDESVLKTLALIGLARQAGFTLLEIRTLLHGFNQDVPPAQRWSRLASSKIVEIDRLISQAQQSRRWLENSLECRCLSLDECVERAADFER